MVNYRPQKFLGLLAPTQYASVTRLSPAFRVRVWLRETIRIAGKLRCKAADSGFKQVQIAYLAVISYLDKLVQPSYTLSTHWHCPGLAIGNAFHFDLRLIILISALINCNVQIISACKELMAECMMGLLAIERIQVVSTDTCKQHEQMTLSSFSFIKIMLSETTLTD